MIVSSQSRLGVPMKRHTARVALATAFFLCATTSLWAGQAARSISTAAVDATSQYLWDSPPVGSDDLDPINWRSSDPVHFSGIRALPGGDGGALSFQAAGYDAKAMLMNAQREAAGPSLMKMYRDALMQETRRSMRRDPSLFWHESFDAVGADIHEGFTMHRARRSAEKIFGEAHQELLANALNHLIETTEPLNALNRRIRGVDFHVRAAGSQSMMLADMDAPSRGARQPSTKVSFVVSNKPRLEMERLLPGGIKASVEIPLASPGLRTTFSKQIAGSMRGTFSFGVEDMGEEYWVSAGVRCGF